MCVLSFVGLFRSNELLNIRLCNITVFSDYTTVKLPESKTDVYREGQDVFIKKSRNFTCPCRLLLKNLDSANITISMSPEYLFRNVVFLKSVGKYVLGNRKISYTCFRQMFKECLSDLGYDQRLFALHSFRSGGTTSTVTNLKNCPSRERLLKLHGRWKSDLAKDMYV